MSSDEGFELHDEVGVGADLQVGGDPLFEHGEAQVLQPADLRLRERLGLEVGERRSTPERQRVAQEPRALRWVRGARLPDELLEAGQIELRRVEVQRVTGWTGVEDVRPEELPQLHDGVLKR